MFDRLDLEGAVAGIRDGVDVLLGAELSALGPRELLDLLRTLETQVRRLAGVDHRLLTEAEERNLPAELACASTAAMLQELVRISPAEAKARVTASRDLAARHALTGELLTPVLPATAAAMAAGSISPAHARVIGKVMHDLPAEVDREFGRAVEACLAQHAETLDPVQLARATARLLARLDADSCEPRDEWNERRRGLTLRRHTDGSADVSGHLTSAAAAVWEAVLDALAMPAPAVDATPDDRTPSQRRHDGLLEAGLRLLRSNTLPDCGGAPVTVLATVQLQELQAQAGYATTGHGELLSVADLLRLAAEAEIIPVVLTDAGGIACYGRSRRTASRAQRRALAARDRGCSFPGCARPPAWCQAHHVRAWLDGGRTDLENLTLLCAYHHREFAGRGWRCQMINSVPHWIPPQWLDPDQRPRRNTAHHVDIQFDVAS